MGRPLIGLTTVQNGSKSISLLGVRLLIDEGRTLAIALVDRSWPGVEEDCTKAVECYVPKVTLIDTNARGAATVPMCGAKDSN